MRIAEIYRSVQGEGLLTGTPSVFVRTSGCNLRCWFCDTPFASWRPEGTDLSVDEVMAQVEEWEACHVVITGGEPMLWTELSPLCHMLRSAGRHITIETAGTLYLPVVCDLMSISPKLANSTPPAHVDRRWQRRHERGRNRPRIVERLMAQHPYQLKFVVDSPDDLAELEQYLQQLRGVERCRVLLMPQGTDGAELAARADWLEPYCREHGYRFCPRRQIEWFGAVRGT